MIKSIQLFNSAKHMLILFGYNLDGVQEEFVFELMKEVSLLNTTTHKAMKNLYKQNIASMLKVLVKEKFIDNDALIIELSKLL